MAVDVKIAKVATPLSGGDGSEVNWRAIAQALTENGVDWQAVPFYVAHLMLENGRRFSGQWNYNVGNIKLPANKRNTGVNYYVLTDRLDSTDAYQAFPSLSAGMAEYVYEAVHRRPKLNAAAKAQDLEAFVTSLYAGETGDTTGGFIGVDQRVQNGWQKMKTDPANPSGPKIPDGDKIPGVGRDLAMHYMIYGAPVGSPFRELTAPGTLSDIRQLVKEGMPWWTKAGGPFGGGASGAGTGKVPAGGGGGSGGKVPAGGGGGSGGDMAFSESAPSAPSSGGRAVAAVGGLLFVGWLFSRLSKGRK